MPAGTPPKSPGAGHDAARRAVVLLSGGLDSCVAAAWAQGRGMEVAALSVDYGQRHDRELQAARAVAQALGVRDHRVVRVDLAALGGSALTDASVEVPRDRPEAAMAHGIPVTYVPARNTILLGMALGLAEVVDAEAVVYGANALDYSGYPDCRPAFVAAFQALADVATKRGVEGDRPIRIEAPLLQLTKADIVRLGLDLKAPLHLTWSCYEGGAAPCGACDSCKLRAKGFAEVGVPDPASAGRAQPARGAEPGTGHGSQDGSA